MIIAPADQLFGEIDRRPVDGGFDATIEQQFEPGGGDDDVRGQDLPADEPDALGTNRLNCAVTTLAFPEVMVRDRSPLGATQTR